MFQSLLYPLVCVSYKDILCDHGKTIEIGVNTDTLISSNP